MKKTHWIVQVAENAQRKWGFDAFYGSDYEVKHGRFTGKITDHMGNREKVTCLRQYCLSNDFMPNECVAIGDGTSDIPLFQYCKKSIALNACDAVEKAATLALRTDDFADILPFIQ
mgnify:CR=1 FL=1